MNKTLSVALVLALAAGLAVADDAATLVRGAVDGQVTGPSAPLPFSKVYAYHLSDQTLSKVVTDSNGQFSFNALPAGLYKVIAFQDGFIPAIALLTRSTREARQFLRMELAEEGPQNASKEDGFWSVREKIPTDVLRDIENEQALGEQFANSGLTANLLEPYQLQTSMQAIAGVEDNAELGASSMTGGRVGVQGEIKDVQVGLQGNFVTLQPVPGRSSNFEASGRTQSLSVSVNNRNSTDVRVSTVNNYMNRHDSDDRPGNYVGLERHQVSWTQDLGSYGSSKFSAEYAEENNFFRQAPIEPYGIPSASRLWRVQGSYAKSMTERATVETGFKFRERQALFDIDSRYARDRLAFVPAQRVDLFGRGGLQVKPNVLVEFGLYSTMRDGSLALAPSGGMAFRLGDNWQAQASGIVRVHDDGFDRLHNDFNTTQFGASSDCQTVEEYCYRLRLAHQSDDLEDLSVGFVQRRYAETLHMYFNQDFFSRLESLYLVQGDEIPEVQFAASRHLTPRILARLASNVAAGGGGILYATAKTSYENEVRYMVTSLDTRFEQTSTGVFIAFHHLDQQLSPIKVNPRRSIESPELELDRLQVMLTQDLDILSRLASDWAVHLNMELSRGNSPETDPQIEDEELRKRVMGGVSVSF